MNVSSYLEAFLTVYGWEVYYVLFVALAMTGLFLYPLLRGLLEILTDYLSDDGSNGSIDALPRAIITIAMAVVVFWFALVPMVKMDLHSTTVKTVCDKAAVSPEQMNNSGKGDPYFANTETRVPIMPWIAMMLGQGMNGIIYKAAPCTMDLSEAKKAQMNVNLTHSEEYTDLKNEFRQFEGECHARAMNVMNQMRDGKFGSNVQKWFVEQEQNAVKDERGFFRQIFSGGRNPSEEEKAKLLYFVDSPFIDQLFYEGGGSIARQPDMQRVMEGMNAEKPVVGYNGYTEAAYASGADGVPPKCGEWWKGGGGKEGLRTRLAKALTDSHAMSMKDYAGIAACRPDFNSVGDGIPTEMTPANVQACKREIIQRIANGDEDNYTRQTLFYNHNNFAKDEVLSTGDAGMLAGAATAAVASTIFAKITGVDLSGGIIGTVTSFYITMFLLKLLMKFLLPMVLMAIYMFWGFYMVIGAMRGSTMVKGMFLIFGLTIVPSLWALFDHLDDKLWDAMYGTSGWTDMFEAILLDTASTIFYFASVMVWFYMINAAGGGDLSGAVKGTSGYGDSLTRSFGRGYGSGAGKGLGLLLYGKSNAEGKIGGFFGGIQNRWNKWRGK